MSLLTTYGASNRVVDSALSVTYSRTRLQGQWSYTIGVTTTTKYEAWQYVRTASKSYRYVGMTEEAAKSCATNMRFKYTRTTQISYIPSGETDFMEESGGSIPMADIEARHVAGRMWEVVINVRETDSRLRFANVSPQSLFVSENSRDYEE